MKITSKKLRIIAWLLAMVTVLSCLLCACGEKKKENEKTSVQQTQSNTKNETPLDDSDIESFLLKAYDKAVSASSGKGSLEQIMREKMGKSTEERKYDSKFSFNVDDKDNLILFADVIDANSMQSMQCYMKDNKSYLYDMQDETYSCIVSHKNETMESMYDSIFEKNNLFSEDYASLVAGFAKVEYTKKTEKTNTVYSFTADVLDFIGTVACKQDSIETLLFVAKTYEDYDTTALVSFTVNGDGVLVGAQMSIFAIGEIASFEESILFTLDDVNAPVVIEEPAWLDKAVVNEKPSVDFNDYNETFTPNAGDEYDLYDYFEITNAESVTFTSSDPTVLTVTNDGKVKVSKNAKHAAKVTITVKATNSLGVTESSEQIFVNAEAPTITVYNDNELFVGTSVMTDTIAGVYCADTVFYESSDESVLSIDENGVVRALKEGSVTVTVTAQNKFGNSQKEVAVNIVGAKPQIFSWGDTEIKVVGGYGDKIFDSILHADDVKIEISDKSVLKADKLGLVLGLKKGSATVTVTATNAYGTETYVCTVTVAEEKPAIHCYFNTDDGLTLNSGEKLLLNYEIDTAYADKITYASSDSKIVSISPNGLLRAVSKGSATVTVTAQNDYGSSTVTFPVTVFENPPEINVYEQQIEFDGTEEDCNVRHYVYVSNADKITYRSSDPTVISVDANGDLTFHANGTVTITVTAQNEFGTESATFKIKLKFKKPEIHDINDNYYMEVNVGEQIEAFYAFQILYAKEVTFRSTNEEVATVDENGVVTTHAAGWASIVITATNPIDTCEFAFDLTVTKYKPVIHAEYDSIEIAAGESDYLDNYLQILYCYGVNDSVTYLSSDTKVVIVTDDGELYAIGKGTANITVNAKNDFGTATYTVKVTVKEFAPELTVHNITAVVDAWCSTSEYMDVRYADTVIVTSSDPSVAWIDTDNWIYTEKAGSVTITVTATNQFGEVTKSFTLTILEDDALQVPYFDIEEGETYYISVEEWFDIPTYVNYAKTLQVVSSNDDIAWVDSDNWIYGNADGSVTVTVIAENAAGIASVTFTLIVQGQGDCEAPVIDIEEGTLFVSKLNRWFDLPSMVVGADSLTVSTTDESIAWVGEDKRIWCESLGAVTVIVTAKNAYGQTTVTFSLRIDL